MSSSPAEFWYTYSSYTLLFLALVAASIHYSLSCPRSLRHLKRVSPYATLWSYAIRESVDQRVRRLILPLAEQGESAVAVYMLGKWGIHLLDPAIIRQVLLQTSRFPKKNYQEHLHFTFLSGPNVVFSNGDQWKHHSACVKSAFDRDIPVHIFTEIANQLFLSIGPGGVMNWSELIQKFTLDVVGKSALGHDFSALSTPSQGDELPFVDHFNRVMNNISTPTRLMFPFLDRWFPRQSVIDDLDALNARYDRVLHEKRTQPGKDILSYLLEDATLTHEELRSNLSILFSAGHDTTSGALSTAVYHLARDPALQAAVRTEAAAVLRHAHAEPTLADLKALPLLDAVIRESLRINPPISLLPARTLHVDSPSSASDVVVLVDSAGRPLTLPSGVPIVPNVYAVHHNARHFPRPDAFLPTGRPENSSNSSNGGATAKGGVFMPFGAGPRQCTARQFSLFEQKTVLALLLLRYEVRLPAHGEHGAHGLLLRNEFGAFGLSVPGELEIEFVPLPLPGAAATAGPRP